MLREAPIDSTLLSRHSYVSIIRPLDAARNSVLIKVVIKFEGIVSSVQRKDDGVCQAERNETKVLRNSDLPL